MFCRKLPALLLPPFQRAIAVFKQGTDITPLSVIQVNVRLPAIVRCKKLHMIWIIQIIGHLRSGEIHFRSILPNLFCARFLFFGRFHNMSRYFLRLIIARRIIFGSFTTCLHLNDFVDIPTIAALKLRKQPTNVVVVFRKGVLQITAREHRCCVDLTLTADDLVFRKLLVDFEEADPHFQVFELIELVGVIH